MGSQILGNVSELRNTEIHLYFLLAEDWILELVKKLGQQGRERVCKFLNLYNCHLQNQRNIRSPTRQSDARECTKFELSQRDPT